MAKEPAKVYTSLEIENLLRGSYAAPSYAYLVNVASATGFGPSRYCDGIAMGIWPSTGHMIHGFEIKVSRGDWVREMQDVSKAAAFARFCDYWWVAASPGIVKLEELPSNWGLTEPLGNGTKVRKIATKNPSPDQMPRSFLAALLRRVNEQCPADGALEAAKKAGASEWKAAHKCRVEGAEDSYAVKSLREQVKAFEEASGIEIGPYSGGKELGDAARRVMLGDRAIERAQRAMETAKNALEMALESVRERLAEIKT